MTANSPWLVVGLGNPGEKYARTRHNVGHMVADVLEGRAAATPTRHRSGTHVADMRLGTLPGGIPGNRVIVATSDGYMNTSGQPVRALMQFLRIEPDCLLVIHDDLDLEPHTLRLKRGGGEGGHNGLKSISQHLGTRDYHRLRIGIGHPPGRQDVIDYVLGRLAGPSEAADWAVTVEQAADAVEDVINQGFAGAQMRLHTAG